jgi:hypothetical protein
LTQTPVRDRYAPWIILAIALAVRLLVAWLLHQPGYTDAYYYAVGARQLADGQGFVEPFIWNYLDPPPTVVHPGYTYWMPLTAIVGSLGLALGGDTFGALQAPFVLLSALLPLVAYGLARDLAGEGLGSLRLRRAYAWLAALLAILPGYYSHVLVLPDNFAPFALAGSLCLWATGRGLRDERPAWFALAGLAAGLGHLARADGLLLAGVALLAALAGGLPSRRTSPPAERSRRRPLVAVGLVLLGYLTVMAPWFARNWTLFSTPLPGAGTRTLFLTTYDDIFAYGRPLTLEQYLAWGWDAILESKLQALALNLQRLWVENLLIALLPFSALGLWRLRHNRLLWPFFLYLPLLFLAMTLAFTFPGMRGGLWHSGGALLPFFFAAAGPGLEAVLRWAVRRLRGWYVHRAWPVFAGGLVGLALLLTLFALWQAGLFDGTWNRRNAGYGQIGQWLADNERGQATVMVGDPPAFAWHTRHPAIAIPNEPLDTILAVAGRYDAAYLVLDQTRPRTTDGLYSGEIEHPRLRPVYQLEDYQVYEIQPLRTP